MSALERALLQLLLEHHPAQLSTDELTRALTAGSEDWAKRDDVAVAPRELVAAGLAHRQGPFAFATHAAVQFERIMGAA